MENNLSDLKKELKEQGLSEQESQELEILAKRLSDFSHLKRSEPFKRSSLGKIIAESKEERIGKRGLFSSPVFITTFSVIIVVFLSFSTFAWAQKSLPGETLYPLKRFSENAISTVEPKFKGEIITRRSQEIKEMVDKKKDTRLLKKTIDDYKERIEQDKKINSDDIKESRKNLEEAKEKSSEENRMEIEKIIDQLDNRSSLIREKDNEEKESDSKKSENRD